MRRSRRWYKVPEVLSHKVVIREYPILNMVAIDRMNPVQILMKDVKHATNTDNGPVTLTASPPSHITNEAKLADNDKNFEE